MNTIQGPDSRQSKITVRSVPPPGLDLLLNEAMQHHQRGQLAEAEVIYRQILALDPRHADGLHLLGTLCHQLGREEMALEFIGKAIALDKHHAAYHSNLGTVLQALGRFEEAASSYRRALMLMPEMAEASMNLGTILQAQGKLGEAESRYRKALALRPKLAEVHVNLGIILKAQGKLDEAAQCHERALGLRPEFSQAWYNLGGVLQAQGKLDEAATVYQRALTLRPGVAEVYSDLGNTLLAQKNVDGAIACYLRALTLKPEYAEAFYNLGNAYQAQEMLDEALDSYQQALKIKPQLPEAHYNLGNTLHSQEKLEEAAASFRRALAFRPTYAEAHYNLGCVLKELGQLDEAQAHMARALAIKPDYPQARFGEALAQLLSGNLMQGWRGYEARWQSEDHDTPQRAYKQPLWTGKKLNYGRLLRWGEQGVGDEIVFAGLLPDAIRTGNRILLDCGARLKALFERSFPEIEVVTGHAPGDTTEREIAAQLPMGSLPGLFRRSEKEFKAAAFAYLKADPFELGRFHSAYGVDKPVVGVAWRTNSPKSGHKRSIELSLFGSLMANSEVRWVSLQYGDFNALEQQVAAAQLPLLIDRTVDQLANIDLFAAQVAAMDLVITIDNSTAHLAGALGVPVWLLLPAAPDWRWRQEGLTSGWYPSVRIFRQKQRGDWNAVLEDVAQALAARSFDGISEPVESAHPSETEAGPWSR